MSLEQQLATLERRGLIHSQSVASTRTSTFKHLLVQDSAYRSLLREERRLLHELTGEVIERLSAGDEPSHAPQLAHHFEQADDYVRAHKYSLLAGAEASRVHAYAEAVDHYERSLRCAHTMQEEQSEALTESFERLGRALELAGDHGRAFDTYAEMEQVGADMGSVRLELMGQIHRATLLSTPSPLMDRPRGVEVSERTLELAQEHGAVEAEIRSLWNLTLALNLTAGAEVEALEYGERGLELAEQSGHRELATFLHNDVGRAYLFGGDVARAGELLKTAERRWRESENLPMLVDSLVTQMGAAVFSGDLQMVPEMWQQANEIAERTGNDWARSYSRMFLEAYYLYRAEYAQCLQVAERTLRMAEQVGMGPIVMMVKLHLAELYLKLNAIDEALEVAESGLAMALQFEHNWKVAVAGLTARIYLRKGQIDRASALIEDFAPVHEMADRRIISIAAIPATLAFAELALARQQWERPGRTAGETAALLQKRGLALHLPWAALIHGRALLLQGQPEAADQAFAAGEDTARPRGMRGDLWALLAARAECAGGMGRSEQRARLLDEAVQIVDDIAVNLEGSRYHESFVSQPEVRALRESTP